MKINNDGDEPTISPQYDQYLTTPLENLTPTFPHSTNATDTQLLSKMYHRFTKHMFESYDQG